MNINSLRWSRVIISAFLAALLASCSGTIPPQGVSNGATLQANPLVGVNFQQVLIGSSTTKSITLTNSGEIPIIISNFNITAIAAGVVAPTVPSDRGSDFSISGLALPKTVSPSSSISLSIAFTPSFTGTVTGSVTFISDASNSPLILTITGVGVTSSASLNLSWDASISPAVAGYHVYRGTQSGGPFDPINLFLILPTQFIDSSVAPSITYFYVVTAVDENAVESNPSNEVQAVIPP